VIKAGYASSIAADVGGVRTYINFTSTAAVGVRANDGKLMWRYATVANRTANVATPVFADNKVFFSSHTGQVEPCLTLTAQNGEVEGRGSLTSRAR
jgi:outer membrane protein assembly factor BamB